MSQRFWWLRAASSIHVGAGETGSLIDLPVMREVTTGYPFLPGSAMKGALRDHWRIQKAKSLPAAETDGLTWSEVLKKADTSEMLQDLFGSQEGAGQLLIGDARLAFLPMRTLSHAFAWVTCPNVLRRMQRDLAFASVANVASETPISLDDQDDERALFVGDTLYLEDYRLKSAKPEISCKEMEDIVSMAGFAGLADFDYKNIVIVNDAFFGYLARRRLPVRMRNRLDPHTKTVSVGALWSEESLPPETLLYMVVADRSPQEQSLATFSKEAPKFLQVGGNETVGEGWLELSARTE
ncbi:type III-B CRISPR module RAMP protein Cmr4 [Oryzibacter oryziterrae]|uniref:type III-B CRISPR module RAMP protein Cmr4 n=1 Tax=Oryzibacter oryziterrae TaxID=2766474 RepID=UPI001F032050|nr:type III-B CRISPR module RAMP protein Cmr4 [Oryzibacter oryziterrae]